MTDQAKGRSISVGLERVLYLAASDPEFRDALLLDRLRAVKNRGLQLSQAELSALKALPTDHLVTIIDGLDVDPGNVKRRGFLRAVAATAATVIAAESLPGCSDDTAKADMGIRDYGYPLDKGSRPDESSKWDTNPDAPKPDMPGIDAGVDAPKDAAPDAKNLPDQMLSDQGAETSPDK